MLRCVRNISIGILALCAFAARAQSADEKALLDERNGELKARAAEVGTVCGATIGATIDWPSYLPAVRAAVQPGTSLRDATARALGGCVVTLGALETVCSPTYKAFGKSAVQNAVTTVACSYDASITSLSGARLEQKAGSLIVRSNLATSDDGESAQWVMKNLQVAPDDAFPTSMSVLERTIADELMSSSDFRELQDGVAQRCGAPLPFVVDWAALLPRYRSVHADTKQAVFSSFEGCKGTLEIVQTLCRRGGLKKAFDTGKVKSLRCTLLDDKAPKKKVTVELGKDGVLTTRLNERSTNFEEQVRAGLERF